MNLKSFEMSEKNHDEEINLSQVYNGIIKFADSCNRFIYRKIKSIFRHKFALSTLFIFGIGLGVYFDKTVVTYKHQIQVKPNFKSVDYLYEKIDLIASKIKEGDTLFLKNIGLANPKNIKNIEIKPIIDVYGFVNQDKNKSDNKNFDILKLLDESTTINNVLSQEVTSKNYSFHTISITSKFPENNNPLVTPLLKYLNDSEYYLQVQKQYLANLNEKIKANAILISQIDAFLNTVSNNNESTGKNIVLLNQTTNIADVFNKKQILIEEQAKNELEKIDYDKIIKEKVRIINMVDRDGGNGKLKFILPLLFVFLYIIFVWFIAFYNKQKNIDNLINS